MTPDVERPEGEQLLQQAETAKLPSPPEEQIQDDPLRRALLEKIEGSATPDEALQLMAESREPEEPRIGQYHPDHSANYRKFLKWMRRNVDFVSNRRSVDGMENLYDLPKDAQLVLATSHLSDIDIQTVTAALGDNLPLVITSLTANQNDPMLGRVINHIGREYFLDVEAKFEGQYIRSKLKPENMQAISESLDEGRVPVIAAMNPSKKEEWEMTKHPGRMLPYVASMKDNVYVVPVAVDIHSPKPIGRATPKNIARAALNRISGRRPATSIHVLNPVHFEKMPKEDLRLYDRYLSDERFGMTDAEKEKAESVQAELLARGEQVGVKIAAALPKEKRGVWQDKLENAS